MSTDVLEPDAATPSDTPDASPATTHRGSWPSAVLVLAVGVGLLIVVCGWHLTQGTATGVGLSDLVELALGRGEDHTLDVLVASRLPRMLAGLCVGIALGAAGALLQSLTRNALASPDTLGVNAGAYFAVTLAAVVGLDLPVAAGGVVAFVGGLVAAVVVVGLAGAGSSTTRIVLAGSAVAMALGSATAALLVLFEEETTGLFVWGNGVLTQIDLSGVRVMGPVIGLGLVASLLLARRLDLLGLGDDTATVLGVRVRTTRVAGTLLAVLLSGAAVALAGPIGFVGLCAPVLVRLSAKLLPSLLHHAVLVPMSAVVGATVVLLSDALLRSLVGAEASMAVPTGVATTLLGAVVLVVVARRSRDAGPTRRPRAARVHRHTRTRFMVVLAVVAAVTVGTLVAGLLLGYTWLLTGDVVNWLTGNAVPSIDFALSERVPRVLGALVAGAALALAGTGIQAVCRNPLAEPGLLGVTAGAGLGAVLLVLSSAVAGVWAMSGAAAAGAVVAFGVVYLVASRGGLSSDRLVLVGVAMQFGLLALTTFLLVRANPWDTPTIYTWLSGTTYGRTLAQVVPVAVAVALLGPLLAVLHRELDLLALDEDTPRVVGVPMGLVRPTVLGASTLLTAAAVTAVGVVGFVGLVAPHAARALVGGRHRHVLPVATLLGAAFLGLADTVGRTVIAPAQIPAGLVVAMVGAPYFVWLLHRSRA